MKEANDYIETVANLNTSNSGKTKHSNVNLNLSIFLKSSSLAVELNRSQYKYYLKSNHDIHIDQVLALITHVNGTGLLEKYY